MSPLVLAAVLLAIPPIEVVNRTGQNLPDLADRVLPPLVALLPAGLERCPPMRVVVRSLDGGNDREYHHRLFPAGLRFQQPRAFADTWAVLTVQGTIEVELYAPAPPERHPFLGRASSRLGYESWLEQNRARRPYAGFLDGPGRLDPWGELLSVAFSNGFQVFRIGPWLERLMTQ